MKASAAELFAGILLLFAWLAGIVAANGFISTFCAIFFPPYAWYLVTERIMLVLGLIGA
jgi:hypothetical protein